MHRNGPVIQRLLEMDESEGQEKDTSLKRDTDGDFVSISPERQLNEEKREEFLRKADFEKFMEKFKKEVTAEVTARIAYTVRIMLNNHLTEVSQICQPKKSTEKLKTKSISPIARSSDASPISSEEKTLKKKGKDSWESKEKKVATKLLRHMEKQNAALEKYEHKARKKWEKYEKRLHKHFEPIPNTITHFNVTNPVVVNVESESIASDVSPSTATQLPAGKAEAPPPGWYASDSEFEVVPQPSSNDCVRVNSKVVSLEDLDNNDSSLDDSEALEAWFQTGNMTSSQLTCILVEKPNNIAAESPEPSIEVVPEPPVTLVDNDGSLVGCEESPCNAEGTQAAMDALSDSFQKTSLVGPESTQANEGFPEEMVERQRNPYRKPQEQLLEKQFASRASIYQPNAEPTPSVAKFTSTQAPLPKSGSFLDTVVSEATNLVSSVQREVVNSVQMTAGFVTSLGQPFASLNGSQSHATPPATSFPPPPTQFMHPSQASPSSVDYGYATSTPTPQASTFTAGTQATQSDADMEWFAESNVSSSLLDRLVEMGFTDRPRNVRLLQRFRGQLDEVIAELLSTEV